MSVGGFQRALDHIRSVSDTEAHKGRLCERLMKAYFREDPIYRERFSEVRLWSEWVPRFNEESARRAADDPPSGPPVRFDLTDTGIDLVARERDGGWCAIQCKCHAPGTRLGKPHLDSFISASARDPFTARIFVDTGDGWGPNAVRTLKGLKPACTVLRFGDLASRPFDWPDLASEEPEALGYAGQPFELRPHQQQAMDDVVAGFHDHDRGKLVMACGTGKTFTVHRLPFSRAIERDLLSDYQVVIFAVAEGGVGGTLQAHLASDRGSEINITDAAKIVGCWRALQRRGKGREDGESDAQGRTNGSSATREAARPLPRAISFATHHPGFQAAGEALGRGGRAGRRHAPPGPAAGSAALLDQTCGRAAQRAGAQGTHRLAKGP